MTIEELRATLLVAQEDLRSANELIDNNNTTIDTLNKRISDLEIHNTKLYEKVVKKPIEVVEDKVHEGQMTIDDLLNKKLGGNK